MKILVVEDSEYKRRRLVEFLNNAYGVSDIHVETSYVGAARTIAAKTFDLALLDMTIPTYDLGPQNSGGRLRTYGGRELARKLLRKNGSCKIIVVTQYEAFSDESQSLSLVELDHAMSAELGRHYLGIVLFDAAQTNWEKTIQRLIGKV